MKKFDILKYIKNKLGEPIDVNNPIFMEHKEMFHGCESTVVIEKWYIWNFKNCVVGISKNIIEEYNNGKTWNIWDEKLHSLKLISFNEVLDIIKNLKED